MCVNTLADIETNGVDQHNNNTNINGDDDEVNNNNNHNNNMHGDESNIGSYN